MTEMLAPPSPIDNRDRQSAAGKLGAKHSPRHRDLKFGREDPNIGSAWWEVDRLVDDAEDRRAIAEIARRAGKLEVWL